MTCERHFDSLFIPMEGVGSIRQVLTVPTRVFGPMVFSVCLLADGTVEILSVADHPDYWEMIAEDPGD